MENHFLKFSESTLQSWLRVKVRRKWEVPKIEHFWAKDLKRDIILKKKGHKVDYGRLKQALVQYYVTVIVSKTNLFWSVTGPFCRGMIIGREIKGTIPPASQISVNFPPSLIS